MNKLLGAEPENEEVAADWRMRVNLREKRESWGGSLLQEWQNELGWYTFCSPQSHEPCFSSATESSSSFPWPNTRCSGEELSFCVCKQLHLQTNSSESIWVSKQMRLQVNESASRSVWKQMCLQTDLSESSCVCKHLNLVANPSASTCDCKHLNLQINPSGSRCDCKDLNLQRDPSARKCDYK